MIKVIKNYFPVLALLLLVASCNNTAKNKVESSDSQEVSEGVGQEILVDTVQSSIHWTGFKVGGSHHGTLMLKSGQLVINGEELVSGSFVVDMHSIVDQDLTDAKMNAMLVNHLKSEDFFDVEKYPEAVFTLTKAEVASTPTDSITHLISGNLKMKDVEKNITFGAKIVKEGDTYKAVTVPFTIDRTQWNVKYGSKTIFSELKENIVSDNIELQITVVTTIAK